MDRKGDERQHLHNMVEPPDVMLFVHHNIGLLPLSQ